MSEHSPGPWSCGKCWETDPATGKGRETDSYAAVDGGDGYIVATVWGRFLPGPTVLANARLIASAPDYYEAVAMMLVNEDCGGHGWWKGWERLKAAQSRAEGAKP